MGRSLGTAMRRWFLRDVEDRSSFAIALAVFSIALVLRIPFVTGAPDTPDSIRLVRGVERFDLSEFAPQFPGYPLAIAMARTMPLAPGPALAVLGAVAGAIAAAAASAAFRDRASAWGAGVAVALLPFAVASSVRVGTDMGFASFLFAAGAFAVRGRGAAAGLLLGLGLGFRPSAFAWAAALVAPSIRKRAIPAFGAGVAIWLLPTLAVVGPAAYAHEGMLFVTGHFGSWGGTSWSAPLDAGSSRWRRVAGTWLLTPIVLPAAVGCVAILLGRMRSRAERDGRLEAYGALSLHAVDSNRFPVVLGSMAYGAWILVAQNPENARHALALAMIVAAWAGAATGRALAPFGIDRKLTLGPGPCLARYAAMGGAGVLVAVWISTDLSFGIRYRSSQPPALEAALRLETDERFDPLLDRVYVSGERAYFTRVGPDWSVAVARTLDEVRGDCASLPVAPRRVWICGSIEGASALPVEPRFTVSRSRDLGAFGARVALYAADPREVVDAASQE